jgi:hypothetical protein
MPSHFIGNLESLPYPDHPNYNLRSIDQSIIDRYYQSYILRLYSSGYQFPPESRYLTEFGHQIPASFVCSPGAGLVLNPGRNYKCLVFVKNEDSREVGVFVARYVNFVKDYVQIFGDRPHSLEVKVQDGIQVTGVGMPSDRVDQLRDHGVIVL